MDNTLTLKVGYGEQIYTPPIGMSIPGYYRKRISSGIINDLYVRAVAFDNGKSRALLFSCDAQGVTKSGRNSICEMLNKEFGVPFENILIHASHSHTSVHIMAYDDTEFKHNELRDAFASSLLRKFADAARAAFESLAPARISIGTGEAKGVGFMRTYEMKDGTIKTNPKAADPNILKPLGIRDDSVQIARITRENEKEIILINFGTHPDTLGGTKYYTDWPGLVVDYVKSAFDGQALPVMINGCQGNSGSVDRMDAKFPDKKGLYKSQRMARIITGEVLKIYDSCTEIPASEIKGFREFAKVGQNPSTPEEQEIAKIIRDKYREVGVSDHPEIKELKEKYGMGVPKAVRIVANLSNPDFFDIEVGGIQIGNLAFIGFSGEPFCEIGLEVKEKSKMDMTMCSCCTNAHNGYFPTAKAFSFAGGYENASSKYAHNIAEKLEETALCIINQMKYEIEE